MDQIELSAERGRRGRDRSPLCSQYCLQSPLISSHCAREGMEGRLQRLPPTAPQRVS